MKFSYEKLFELGLVVLPAIACMIALPFAKEPVPMQWNLQGNVTWYAPASWGLPLLPAILIGVYIVFHWMERRDPERFRETDGSLSAHGKATDQIRLALVMIFSAISVVQIAWALGHRPDSGRGVLTIAALFISFLGNQFGKLKPNSYVGFRIRWTLGSEFVWRRTHRAAGWLWTTTGIAVALSCWFLPESVMRPGWAYAWVFLLLIPPYLVAWNAARIRH